MDGCMHPSVFCHTYIQRTSTTPFFFYLPFYPPFSTAAAAVGIYLAKSRNKKTPACLFSFFLNSFLSASISGLAGER
ncbi:hypothetical protein IWZ03DRAFT_370209 [Phyllosticta citriasiana]|uniref:Uncharacterized protein n=1 Tax=Phyllosticta citriasiana TaxID=595635 RepID=A0ABR1KWQ8_9PEZI